ncbi:MAG: hypothetical protein EBU90_08565 [Proteobacteria bacterium]|jgi:hypothetical protein|nr:hypothetical protein [Pseudomonadota bacterium]
METVTIGVDTLKRIIRDLESAVSVCHNVDSSQGADSEKTYPYATGYSRAAMTSAIMDLNNLIAK